MAYTFRYRLLGPIQPSVDGSGVVYHDVCVIYSVNGDWVEMPERHKTICVPYAELDAALAQPDNPLRVSAYKDALASNLNTMPEPNTGWAGAQLLAFMETNDAARATAEAAETFVLAVYPTHEFPVDFDM